MDGTILSSIAAAERVWTLWAERNGIEVGPFLPTIHGVQAVETLRRQGLSQSDAEREAAAITLLSLRTWRASWRFLGRLSFYQHCHPTDGPSLPQPRGHWLCGAWVQPVCQSHR